MTQVVRADHHFETLRDCDAPRPEKKSTLGRDGAMHTEHLGHLLTEMQWLQRAYPGATW